MPTRFPKEFRDDVVRVALAQIAKDLDIHIGALDTWMRQARTDGM